AYYTATVEDGFVTLTKKINESKAGYSFSSSSSQSFSLPDDVDSSQAKIEKKEGKIIIRLPKLAEGKKIASPKKEPKIFTPNHFFDDPFFKDFFNHTPLKKFYSKKSSFIDQKENLDSYIYSLKKDPSLELDLNNKYLIIKTKNFEEKIPTPSDALVEKAQIKEVADKIVITIPKKSSVREKIPLEKNNEDVVI
nr:hypothetical protein [Bacteriovoracaceae bacterium]